MAAEKGFRAAEMEGYGYGDEGGGIGSSFGQFGRQSSTASSTGPQPTKRPFDMFGAKAYLASMFGNTNFDLLISKTFYFFFFSAFGSLFPLIAVYFKQLGMNPVQTGVLIGFRPFVEFLAGPFWGSIAEKWHRFKEILLFALFCWVAFTLALAFIGPPAHSCLVHNGTHITVAKPWGGHDRTKRSLDDLAMPREEMLHFERSLDRYTLHKRAQEIMDGENPLSALALEKRVQDANKTKQTSVSPEVTTKKPQRIRYLPHPSIDAYGMSPLPIDHKDIANLDEINSDGLVSPPLSAVVYRQKDINEVFFILLVLMVIGEFVSSPAIALADTATLGYLGEDKESYGKHRMLGSVGWALAMFIVGIALDHSNIFPNHPCGNEQLVDRNYTVCFAIFSVLMCCAFLTATQFKFETDAQQNIPLDEMMKDKMSRRKKSDRDPLAEGEDEDSPMDRYDRYVDPNRTGAAVPHPAYEAYVKESERKVHISLQGQGGIMISDGTIPGEGDHINTFIPRGQPGQVGTLPAWMTVMKMLATVQHISSVFVLWYMGFGVGLVFAFLFWHLQDLHGTPTLFGFASVINHLSEILAFFFAQKLIMRFGHVKVFYMGLVGNVARFMYISWLRNPWWVLPFELLQGLTHAVIWANGCSFVIESIPSQHKATAQGILSAIHHGLGRGCGAIIGGAFVSSFGSEATFRGYGICTLVVLAGYIILNYFILDKYGSTAPPPAPDRDPQEGGSHMEETSHLAPCGVPMSSMSHSLSGSRLDKQEPSYGTKGPGKTNGYLDPGNTNPQSSGYYQYKLGPCNKGHITLGGPPLHRSRIITRPKDCATIRNNFEAYDAAMEPVSDKHLHTHALLMSHAPAIHTEMYLQQPDNTQHDQDF